MKNGNKTRGQLTQQDLMREYLNIVEAPVANGNELSPKKEIFRIVKRMIHAENKFKKGSLLVIDGDPESKKRRPLPPFS